MLYYIILGPLNSLQIYRTVLNNKCSFIYVYIFVFIQSDLYWKEHTVHIWSVPAFKLTMWVFPYHALIFEAFLNFLFISQLNKKVQCVAFARSLTFRLGFDPQRCWTLSRAVFVVRHHTEGILGVWHEVLNGDLHFSWTTGVHDPLPVQDERNKHDMRLKQEITAESLIFPPFNNNSSRIVLLISYRMAL